MLRMRKYSMEMEISQYTTPVISLGTDNSIHDALQLMQKNDIKRIVVVSKFPLGIVTERDIGKFLEKDKSARPLDKIPLDEIMSRNLVTITAGQRDHFIQCAIRMETFQISSVIVVDDEGKLFGITTKSDLAKSFSDLYRGVYKVKDYMSTKVFTCRKSDSLLFALNMLNRNKITRVIVTDNQGKPIGVISYDTFLRNSEYFRAGQKITTQSYLLPNTSAKNMLVGDLLGNELLSIGSEEDLARAAKLMTEFKVSGIPVVDNEGNLEGIVSSSDITRAYSEVETHARLIERDPHFA